MDGADTGFWMGLAGLVTAGLSGIAAAVVVVMNARHKNRQEKTRTDLDAAQAMLDRQEAQLARHAQDQREKQDSIDQLFRMSTECREFMAAYQTWGEAIYESWQHMAEVLRKSGHDPGTIQKPPKAPRHRPEEDPAFIRATAAQNTELLRQLDPRREQP